MPRATLALLLALLLTTPLPAAPDPAVEARVAEWIEQLSDDDFASRRRAYDRLAETGEAALPALTRALLSDDPEVSLVVRRLMAEIQRRAESGLLDTLSDRKGDFRKTESFAKLVGQGRELLPELVRIIDEEDARGNQYDYYRFRNAYSVLAELVGPGDLPLLLDRLRATNPQHRQQLRNILEEMDREMIRTEVFAVLADAEAHPQVRAHLMEMCVNTSFSGNDPRLAKIAPKLLDDESPLVRSAALRYLSFRNDPAVHGRILELCRDEEAAVRSAALSALRSYSGPDSVTALTNALLDPEPEVRSAALQSLRTVAGPDLAPRIRPYLKDPDPNVRANAARVLAGFGDKSALLTLITLLEERNEEFLTRTLHAVVDAIGQIGDPVALEPLFALLEAGSEFERIRNYNYLILRGIVRLGGPEVLPRIEPWIRVPEAQNLHVLLDEIGRMDSPRVIPILMLSLERGESHVRAAAVRALQSRDHRAAAPRILELLTEVEDSWFRSSAVQALAAFEYEEAAPAIVQLLALDASDPNLTSLFYSLIRAVGQFEIHDAAPRVAEIALENSGYRSMSCDLLGQLGNEEARPALLAMYGDEENVGFRHRLALALGRLGEPAPLTARLLEMADDVSPTGLVTRAEALIVLDRFEEARPLMAKALEGAAGNGSHVFNVACLHALLGEKDRAFELLHSATNLRTFTKQQLRSDPDLRSLRDDERFEGLLEKAR